MPDHAVSDDPAVQRQLDRLTMLSPGRDVLGLERITALLDRLDNPHRKLPPVFHVAGTNGKGSTCAFLRAALEAAGHRVNVYSSPHLVRFNERIRVAGTLIADEALAPLLAEVLDCSADIAPSFFEATTAAAFLAFSRTPADACIVEVGLGGRLDATNVIEAPLICGIAQIGIDHEAFLLDPANGPDWPPLERIAWEKAGIAKRGVPLVALDQPPEAEARIAEVAEAVGAPLKLAFGAWHYGYDGVALHYRDAKALMLPYPAMAGEHQCRNFALAVAMLRHQDRLELPLAALRAAAGAASWPARMQRLAPGPLTHGREIWIDGAHNRAAAEAVAEVLVEKPMHLILGILANKDADGIVAALAAHALSLTFVAVPGHASHDPQALAERYGGHAAQSFERALADIAALSGPVLIVGSLYLAGAVLAANGQPPV